MQAVTITKTESEGTKIRGESTTIGMVELQLNHYATIVVPKLFWAVTQNVD